MKKVHTIFLLFLIVFGGYSYNQSSIFDKKMQKMENKPFPSTDPQLLEKYCKQIVNNQYSILVTYHKEKFKFHVDTKSSLPPSTIEIQISKNKPFSCRFLISSPFQAPCFICSSQYSKPIRTLNNKYKNKNIVKYTRVICLAQMCSIYNMQHAPLVHKKQEKESEKIMEVLYKKDSKYLNNLQEIWALFQNEIAIEYGITEYVFEFKEEIIKKYSHNREIMSLLKKAKKTIVHKVHCKNITESQVKEAERNFETYKLLQREEWKLQHEKFLTRIHTDFQDKNHFRLSLISIVGIFWILFSLLIHTRPNKRKKGAKLMEETKTQILKDESQAKQEAPPEPPPFNEREFRIQKTREACCAFDISSDILDKEDDDITDEDLEALNELILEQEKLEKQKIKLLQLIIHGQDLCIKIIDDDEREQWGQAYQNFFNKAMAKKFTFRTLREEILEKNKELSTLVRNQ